MFHSKPIAQGNTITDMFSHEASHWEELELNGNDDFTHVFKQANKISFLIIPFLLMFANLNELKEGINNTLKKRLQHYKDEIQKLKNESYATIISSIISFLLYAVKQAMVFSCRVFIIIFVSFSIVIFVDTVTSDKRLVNNIIRTLLSSAQLVLSDDSIRSIISFLQSAVKLVFSYGIIISRNISFSLFLMEVLFSYGIILNSIITFSHSSIKLEFSYFLAIIHCFIPKFPRLLSLCTILCGTITLFAPSLELMFQKLNVLTNYASQLKAGWKLEKEKRHQIVDQLQEDQLKVAQQQWQFELTWYNDEQRQFTIDDQQKLQDDQEKLEDKQELINVQEQLNTDQQNATVEKQEFIKVQEQLNTNQQDATVNNQELINVQQQLNTDQQNATVDKQELIKVQEQLNTDQQDATVNNQELINVQQQFNTDQQNATVDKQELINVQEQLNSDQQNAKVDKQEFNNVQGQFNTDQQNATVEKQEFIKVQEELNTDQQDSMVHNQEFINVQEQLNTNQQNAKVDKQEFNNVQEQLNTNQQNATVDKQEFIKLQEQLNTNQQDATVHNQEFINVQEQLNTNQQDATVDKQEFVNVQGQLNTDQQDATVDNQELIKLQEQLNTDQQNAAIDNQASNNEQRQLQIQTLKDEYQKLKHEYLQQLQRKGHVCAKNCVLCTILWSCQQELGFYLCGPQLILIMFLHAAEKIKREYLKCEKFIEIFMKCKVIDAPLGCEYLWSEEMSKKSEMIEKAWNALMNMDKGVCLMGIKSSKALGGGHCVVCDLNTRTECGTVMFHDPQKEEKAEWSKKEFIDYLDDPNIAGLRLFTVNLQELKQIINDYSDILHHTD